jgi:protein-ribulosamine 3-kinase
MDKALLNYISRIIDNEILDFNTISSGSVTNVYQLTTGTQKYIVKTYESPEYQEMMQAESKGLDQIKASKSFITPAVISLNEYGDIGIMISEYIDSDSHDDYDFDRFGSTLAGMHCAKYPSFGLDYNNYIGTLMQLNQLSDSWPDFYIEYRLKPQFDDALARGLLRPGEVIELTHVHKKMIEWTSEVQPSLIHGDLWNGNYIFSKDKNFYLIDPAISYADSDMDIAMTVLFGGFRPSFYTSYYSVRPKSTFHVQKINLYQLYYLLIHLNLFGRNYYKSVIEKTEYLKSEIRK